MRILIGLAIALAACGDDPADPPGCPAHWTVASEVAGARATIEGGELVLHTPSVPMGRGIAIEREIVDAEFDITFQVAAVTLGGVGGYVRATIEAPSGDRLHIGLHQTAEDTRVEARSEPVVIETHEPTTAALATLRFVRTGDELEGLATAGEHEAGLTDLGFAGSPLMLRLELGGSVASGSPVAASFASFDVAAGTLEPDPFDCDTLR